MKNTFKQTELQWAIQNNKPILEQVIRASIQKYKEYLSKQNRQLRLWE